MKMLHYMLQSFEDHLDPTIQYLTELSCSSVTNNCIMYQIEGAVLVKKAT